MFPEYADSALEAQEPPAGDARARHMVKANGSGNAQPIDGLAPVPTHHEPDAGGDDEDHLHHELDAGGDPGDDEDRLRRGREALAAINRDGAFERWLLVAEAIEICQTRALLAACTNKPEGRRFTRAMSKLLQQHKFDAIDKGDRSRLLGCLAHRDEIAIWRRGPGARYSHPNSVWRHWQRFKNQGAGRSSRPPLSPEAETKRRRKFLEAITLEGMLRAMPEWRAELERRLDGLRGRRPPAHDPDLTAGSKLAALAEKGTAKDIAALVKRIVKQADGRDFGIVYIDRGSV